MNTNNKGNKKIRDKKVTLLWPIILILIIVLSVVLLIVTFCAKNDGRPEKESEPLVSVAETTEAQQSETTAPETEQQNKAADDWRLFLVNKWHPLPPDYSAEIVEYTPGKYVDARITKPLDELISAAREDGYNIVVRSGYRPSEEQLELYNERLQRLIDNGMSRADAEVEILKWVAYPGTSEHELGLSCDMNGDRIKTTDDEAYEWLLQNAYKFHHHNTLIRYYI